MDQDHNSKCHCPFDCEETKYSYTVSRNIFHGDTLTACRDNSKWDWLYGFLDQAVPDLVRLFRNIVFDEIDPLSDMGIQNFCQEYVQKS